MSKVAFLTGVTGQDGTYLTELLLSKGYTVWGMVRRCSHSDNIERLKKISNDQVNVRYGDLTDPISIRKILRECKPDEVYNLGAQSHVRISFDIPEYTASVNAVGVIDILSAVHDIVPEAKFYQASTSEMFGTSSPPQNENTTFRPTSPYGAAKLHAYWEVKNSRKSMGLFTCNGVLYNHESPRRGGNFVTRKITSMVAKIKLGKEKKMSLGNLEAKRDWGHAEDYVRAMYMMLQHDFADDYVVATGVAHTVRAFLERTLKCADIDFFKKHSNSFEPGDPRGEQYCRSDTGEVIVDIDPRFYRPVEVDYLCGDSTKIRTVLGWKPEVSFDQLVLKMLESDLFNFSLT